jgi:hypothetical protein
LTKLGIYNEFNVAWKLSKLVAGTETDLVLYTAVTPAAGNTYAVRLEMRGSRIRGLLNGVGVADVNDTSFTTPGRAGIFLEAGNAVGAGWNMDNLGAFDTNESSVYFKPIPFQGRGRNL